MRIKDLREDKNFLQKDVANLLCITQAQYSRIESGINQLSYDGLIKLSYIYNTSIDYILGITNEIKPYPRCKGGGASRLSTSFQRNIFEENKTRYNRESPPQVK